MFYSEKLFESETESSFDTIYDEKILGAFYDCYHNRGEDVFYMDEEDRKSLQMRFSFFENYFKNTDYPIFVPDSIKEILPKNYIIMMQVTGLPEELYYRFSKKTHEKVYLSRDEILSRIRFVKGLRPRPLPEIPEDIDDDFFSRSDLFFLEGINYLASIGVYYPDLNRLSEDPIETQGYLPVVFDMKYIPEKYQRKVTPEELLIDYCPAVLSLSLEEYQSGFEPLRKLSLEELVSYAFVKHAEKEEDRGITLAAVTVRSYINALVREMINDHFKEKFGIYQIIYQTVLHKDYEIYNYKYKNLAIGKAFTMLQPFKGIIYEKDGKPVYREELGEYMIQKKDLKRMKLGFELIKKTMKNNPQYGYSPFFFIALLGLPYAAFEKAKYFDFQEGDFKAFCSLYSLVDRKEDLTSIRFLPGVVRGDGSIIPWSKVSNPLPLYLLMKDDIFVSQPAFFLENSHAYFDTLIDEENSAFHNLMSGDANTINEILKVNDADKAFYANMIDMQYLQEKNGVIPFIQKLFGKMKESGNSFRMQYFKMFSDSNAPFTLFMLLRGFFSFEHKKFASALTKYQGKTISLKAFPFSVIEDQIQKKEYIPAYSFMLGNECSYCTPFLIIYSSCCYFEVTVNGTLSIYNLTGEYQYEYLKNDCLYLNEQYQEIFDSVDYLRWNYKHYIESYHSYHILDEKNHNLIAHEETVYRKTDEFDSYYFNKFVLRSLLDEVLYENLTMFLQTPREYFPHQLFDSVIDSLTDDYESMSLTECFNYAANIGNDDPEYHKRREFLYYFIQGKNHDVYPQKNLYYFSMELEQNGKKFFVSPSKYFHAYSLTGEVDDFHFLKKDEEKIVEFFSFAISNLKKSFSTSKILQQRAFIYFADIPHALILKAREFYRNVKTVTAEEVEKYFGFIDLDVDETEIPETDYFRVIPECSKQQKTHSFYQYLMDHGVYLFNGQIPSNEIPYPQPLRIFLSSKLGPFEQRFFYPSFTSYTALIDDYLDSGENNLNAEESFMMKEILISLFQRTDSPIADLVYRYFSKTLFFYNEYKQYSIAHYLYEKTILSKKDVEEADVENFVICFIEYVMEKYLRLAYKHFLLER